MFTDVYSGACAVIIIFALGTLVEHIDHGDSSTEINEHHTEMLRHIF